MVSSEVELFMSTLPPVAEMEQAYLNRDASYDGLFFLGVRTTGIFCRPTCPARSPLPRNVEYFPSVAKALFAGYRPCKRCRPMAEVNQPDWAAALLAEIDADPGRRITESDLRSRGLDPATARRHFLRNYGMTFQAYSRARRLTNAFTGIRNGESLDGAAYDSGYESLSGFREAFGQTFACPPGKSLNRPVVLLAWLTSPLGPLIAGATDDGLCLLEFTDRRMLEAQFETIRKSFQSPAVPGMNVHLEQVQQELDAYFEGRLVKFTVPLVYPGTDFQRRVWNELQRIPYGETRSYQELATTLGDAGAVRAVGRANGLNRIAILIPCHRVINKDGGLGGYGGGLRRKQFLLDFERSNARAIATGVAGSQRLGSSSK
ncbi:bifunctional transcriptional activator/DNA repair enzyme AdaA [Schlesneria sp. T3-172]|uniref:bifunctional transcriptional activator/DNA repair enzyme AdaA n=1 Tax=Schlesneria sphaerica TaxID=3373610 RepID=UPI0037C9DEC2